MESGISSDRKESSKASQGNTGHAKVTNVDVTTQHSFPVSRPDTLVVLWVECRHRICAKGCNASNHNGRQGQILAMSIMWLTGPTLQGVKLHMELCTHYMFVVESSTRICSVMCCKTFLHDEIGYLDTGSCVRPK